MTDIRAHLERKKAKLQALREEKERLRKEKEQKELTQVEEAALRAANLERDVDELLSSLGAVSLSDVPSDFSSPDARLSDQSFTHLSIPQTFSPASTYSTSKHSGHSQQSTIIRPQLTVKNEQIVNIAPQHVETYMKYTQTDEVDRYGFEAEDANTSVSSGEAIVRGLPCEKHVESAHQMEQTPTQRVELSEEEKERILLSEAFDQAARVMERALCETLDIYTDYSGIARPFYSDATRPLDEQSGARLFLNRCFYEERWSRNRCVTSLSWSPNFPELLAASYHRNEDSPNDPEGVCLIWNTKYKKTTPEYIFYCQSPVLSTTFSRFHPNLVFGGTYSGQIVLWDNRVRKKTPIQRTPLSANAHTHPVFCLSVVGTQSADNLISVSTDGRLCSWSLEMLSQPQDMLQLEQKHKQGKTVAPSCFAFPANSSNNFILGCQDGSVYSACRHGRNAGILELYEGHDSLVTGISSHGVQGGIDFSHLFLTSSFDWTIKLWSLKESKPLYSFEDNGDYVYDVAWSPIHPALFAAVDGTGRLSLWNLNENTEIPTASVMVDGCPALNQVSWASSGLQVIVGDDTGRIWVYRVSEHLANPHGDEWSNFARTLLQLKNSWS
ncbi:cytoplasmic dynein 1 intermediate chain isoform X2 [Anabrus simplex]|uniref:cytoplasmic dynein 1 intermediate chain isoform X2 n=1 Tax=Anabrus simplex TaxID=316456 RepID=UPI0035A37245